MMTDCLVTVTVTRFQLGMLLGLIDGYMQAEPCPGPEMRDLHRRIMDVFASAYETL